MHAHNRPTLYQQLEALPEGLTGEILDAQLYTQPRPSGRHGRASSILEDALFGPYDRGRGGPGGWWIFIEPEIHFRRDLEIAVPDLAGWRRERMPVIPEGHRFEVVPDWICEIPSKSSASKDREIKMPIYARYGVAYAWLVDPLSRTLEAYARDADVWRKIASCAKDDQVTLPPFDAVRLALADLWVPR
jgi:Uma2 family endonuclease